MRDLMNSEVSNVGGGGDAICIQDEDGKTTCDGDTIYGTIGGDIWVVGDNGTWHVERNGDMEFFPSDDDRSLT